MEMQYQQIENEMPIPDEHTKQKLCAVPNSKVVMNDYSNYK